MILSPNGDITSEDDDCQGMPPLTEEDREEEEVPEPVCEPVPDLQVLVARRVLTARAKEDEQLQRENLFYTRCKVGNKVCSLIIDGGSCANVASSLMVEKLGLATTKHPHPYRL